MKVDEGSNPQSEHWILQIEKVVAVIIMLAMLKLSGAFLVRWNLEIAMQFGVFVAAIGLLFSNRIAYIAMLTLLWYHIGLLGVSSIHFMLEAGTAASALGILLLLVLIAVALVIVYFTDVHLKEKYRYSKQLNRIVIFSGLILGTALHLVQVAIFT